jgi:hypothetical protein
MSNADYRCVWFGSSKSEGKLCVCLLYYVGVCWSEVASRPAAAAAVVVVVVVVITHKTTEPNPVDDISQDR